MFRDILVIGAGVLGLSSAYHLKRLNPDKEILVIDKNVHIFTHIVDHHYIIEKGQMVWSGTSNELQANPSVRHQYLGL